MITAWVLLFQSRKFWVGTITVMAVALAVALVALGKLEQAQLVPTIAAITGIGIATIGSIAWEGTAQTKAVATVVVAKEEVKKEEAKKDENAS